MHIAGTVIGKKEAAIALGGLALGAFLGYNFPLWKERFEEWRYDRERAKEPRMTPEEIEEWKREHKGEYTSLDPWDEPGEEVYPLINSEKPDIFEVGSDEGDAVDEKPGFPEGLILNLDEFMAVPEENRAIATYFVEDEILAGYDDDLDVIDPEKAYGGIREEAFEMIKYGSGGVYIMCGDGVHALEIVASNGNYLEEYTALHQEE